MAHEIDMKNFNLRTDMIIDTFDHTIDHEGISYKKKMIDDIVVDLVTVDKKGEKVCGKKQGVYQTITFKDVTDKDNYQKVQQVLVTQLKEVISSLKLKKDASYLIVGLGNEKSTPDSLGPKVVENTLVTRYLFHIGEVEEGYSNTASFIPGVTGVTGIETKSLIDGVVNSIHPDLLIVIDALASSSIERVNKTIQITDAGILPGSGIGNSREEISKDTMHIPVIAIGVPTVVDSATIVFDTIKYMFKQFSFKIKNIDNQKLKFVSLMNQNYINEKDELTEKEKEQLFGIVGSLEDSEMKQLLLEVLSPIDYNLMVTPKEVDFIIDKLSTLIGGSINKVLHSAYNTTN